MIWREMHFEAFRDWIYQEFGIGFTELWNARLAWVQSGALYPRACFGRLPQECMVTTISRVMSLKGFKMKMTFTVLSHPFENSLTLSTSSYSPLHDTTENDI